MVKNEPPQMVTEPRGIEKFQRLVAISPQINYFLSGQDVLLLYMITVIKEGTAQWEALESAGLATCPGDHD
jgi:hypothetical protein